MRTGVPVLQKMSVSVWVTMDLFYSRPLLFENDRVKSPFTCGKPAKLTNRRSVERLLAYTNRNFLNLFNLAQTQKKILVQYQESSALL